MLIQYTPISSLDQAARARLKRAASGLLTTNEASLGYVMFEGKYYSAVAVQQLADDTRQILTEG